MRLRMTVRDCLFLNWALPARILPDPPPPLRYQLHPFEGRNYTFVSALLLHQDSVRLSALPMLRLSYPQLDVRHCVLDGDGTPSVLYRRMLMPAWVAPGARLFAHQPASPAHLRFARPSRNLDDSSWRWQADHRGRLTVSAAPAPPRFGEGPRVGSWEETVRYFQERPWGYAQEGATLHRFANSQPPNGVWPLRAEVDGVEVVANLLDLSPGALYDSSRDADRWPALHSAWLAPELAFSFALALVPKVAHGLPQPLPQPAGRVAVAAARSRL
jgi:Uncharacterized conserved protein (COG2071)